MKPVLPRPAHALFAGLVALAALPAGAATIIVGPDEIVSRISEAARVAKDGDTVLIRPGTYRGGVATWNQKSLEIRGVGGRPVMLADGSNADGKAIWVFPRGRFRVENIEFRGARVPDGNGAGIRFEDGRLDVDNCVFEDNENGILTANSPEAELHVRDSSFSRAPQNRNDLHHLLYVGRIKRFSIEGSRFHQGYHGHLIKSRAARSEIRYNLLVDGQGGEAAYELEFPNGGVAVVVGNVIAQSASTSNPVIVGYGAEGRFWSENRLAFAHNTLVADGWHPAWFLRAWTDRLPPDTRIVTRNNLTVGIGPFTSLLSGDHRGNYAMPPGYLNPGALDFTLDPGSFLRGHVDQVEDWNAGEMIPTAEFALPIGTQPLEPPLRWSPGAFQSTDLVLRTPPRSFEVEPAATAPAAPASPKKPAR